LSPSASSPRPFASPSPPRLLQNLSPFSPDLFLDSSPRSFRLRVRRDLLPDIEKQSTFSPSMLDLPLVRPPQLYNSLVIGKIIYSLGSTTLSGTDWGNDGYDEELVAHVVAYEQKWGERQCT